jgi:hypothetical protein
MGCGKEISRGSVTGETAFSQSPKTGYRKNDNLSRPQNRE